MDEEWIDDHGDARLMPEAALIALLVGCLLLVGAAIGVPHLVTRAPLVVLAVGGVVLGLAAWLVGLPLGLRRANMTGRVGALLILVVGGAVAGLSADRTLAAASRRDASSFAEAEIAPGGVIALPKGTLGRGPISNLYGNQRAEEESDRTNERSVLANADFRSLNGPYLLEQDPSPLTRCDSVSVLKGSTSRMAERDKARAAKLAAAIDRSGLSDTLRNGIRMMLLRQNSEAELVQELAALDVTEAECRLLARRSWRDSGGYFAFGSAGDSEAYKAIQMRSEAITKAQAELASADNDRVHRGQNLVRDTLSQ